MILLKHSDQYEIYNNFVSLRSRLYYLGYLERDNLTGNYLNYQGKIAKILTLPDTDDSIELINDRSI